MFAQIINLQIESSTSIIEPHVCSDFLPEGLLFLVVIGPCWVAAWVRIGPLCLRDLLCKWDNRGLDLTKYLIDSALREASLVGIETNIIHTHVPRGRKVACAVLPRIDNLPQDRTERLQTPLLAGINPGAVTACLELRKLAGKLNRDLHFFVIGALALADVGLLKRGELAAVAAGGVRLEGAEERADLGARQLVVGDASYDLGLCAAGVKAVLCEHGFLVPAQQLVDPLNVANLLKGLAQLFVVLAVLRHNCCRW